MDSSRRNFWIPNLRELPAQNTKRVWCIYEVKSDTLSAAKQTFVDICRSVIKSRNLVIDSTSKLKDIECVP